MPMEEQDQSTAICFDWEECGLRGNRPPGEWRVSRSGRSFGGNCVAICQDSQGYGQDRAAECQLHDFMMANYVITQLGHVNGWRQAQSTVQILDVASVKDVGCVSC